MKSPDNSAASRDIAHVLHPYTNLKKHQETGPLVLTEGKGVWIYDDQGNAYLDGMAGLWCAALGYGEERLVEAASAQMRRLPFSHLFVSKSHEPAANLAEKLIAIAPVPMSKVFFANSGSEATDTALKLVWFYNNALGRPKKKKIISRHKAYHGVTIAAASMTGLPLNHRDFDLPIDKVLHAECPHFYHFGEAGESEEEFAARMANNLNKLILSEGPETVAAFIAEPVMGAGGVIVPPRTYFDRVQPILKKHDVLLIADEVICGFGRTGNMFGCQTFGIEPDMMTVAKALSSAYLPISALLINEKVFEAVSDHSDHIGTFAHGFTYSGHPVSAAVALETLAIYEERDIVGHVREVAPRLQEGLGRLADHPLVGEVRGVGLVAGVELVKDKVTRGKFDAAQQVGPYVVGRAQEHGAMLRPLPGDTVAFSPPLVISPEEIDLLVERFGRALDDTVAWLAGS